LDEYFEELKKTGTFAGEYEILNSSLLYSIHIIIYTNFQYTPKINSILPQNLFNLFIPKLLLGWCNNNHYILLEPKITTTPNQTKIPNLTNNHNKNDNIQNIN